MASPRSYDAGKVLQDDARKSLGSNIGIRRQRLASQDRSPMDGRTISPGASLQKRSIIVRRRTVHQSKQPSDLNRSERNVGSYPRVADDSLSQLGTTSGTTSSSSSSYKTRHSRPSDSQADNSSFSALTILSNPDFNFLPVAKTPQAQASFDFYANSYVMSIIEVSPHDLDKYSRVVHQILHDELLFISFTTCSDASRWRMQDLHAHPPLSVVRGYGKTISLLAERLRSASFNVSPAILLTMWQLVVIEWLTKNVSATAKHLAGIQSIMAAKKDVKPTSNSSPVQAAIDVWETYFAYRDKVKAIVDKTAPLSYPVHPFYPELGIQVATLPIGFADTLLSGRVSIEILDLMGRFNSYFVEVNHFVESGIADSAERTHIVLQQAAYCIEYAQIQGLSLIERLILVGLTAYVVRKDRIHKDIINIRGYYQIMCANVLNAITTTPLEGKEHDNSLTIWIGLVLLLTSTPEAYARKLALKMLPGKPQPLKMLKRCQEFFWDDDLTNALLSGSVLGTQTSNDLIAQNVRQTFTESEG